MSETAQPEEGAGSEAHTVAHDAAETDMADPERILATLDDTQRSAALAVDGPVRIIAVAGAGKTRTITRRIAYACASGAWDPTRVLAVTFSVKAANEMREQPGCTASASWSARIHVPFGRIASDARGVARYMRRAFPRRRRRQGLLVAHKTVSLQRNCRRSNRNRPCTRWAPKSIGARSR